MNLNTVTRNAIHLLQDLNVACGAVVTLDPVAKKHNISRYFLEQIARKLRMGGLIKSVRGPGGGYLLVKNRISLADVQEVFIPVSKRKLVVDSVLDRQFKDALESVRIV